ncbi:MAG TPA: acyl carrier protein [Mycobacteriales bacterium]|nr:acyl carrier protein [Mycobacteriales bacterium]
MTRAELTAAVRDTVAGLIAQPLAAADDERALAEISSERYDSLAVLDCVGLVEQRFGVEVDLVEDDLRTSFRSVASIAALVERKQHDAAVLGAAFPAAPGPSVGAPPAAAGQ